MDYETRHYVFVGPDGTIGLSLRWTGEIPDIHYPIQMLNEYQRGIPQPYADPPYKQRGGSYNLHANMWFVSLRQPQAFFQRCAIPAENFEEASTDPHCKWFNFSTGLVELRPGHCYVGIGCHAGPAYRNLVKLSHYAYGGKPIYYIQREARLHEWEMAELMQYGMLHPLVYQPEPRCLERPARKESRVLQFPSRRPLALLERRYE